jgi:adenosine deaminase/aminodeoxyfutalosine deaminase
VSVRDFIRQLPKAELHLHLEGSVAPPTLAELSRRHNTPLPVEGNNYKFNPDSGRELSEEDVRQLYRYDDFHGFLMAFKAVTERLRTPEDYELVTYRLMQKLKTQNVAHAEVYVSVGVIYWRGQEFDPIFEGLERGRERGERDFGVSLLWIFDAVRHFGVEAAERVFKKAAELRDRNVVGIGIGGDEQRGPAIWFRDLYARAADQGLRLTCHAGENTGPESIWSAIRDLKAERIGHGLTAIHDPALMDYLAEHQIPIEICLSSNVRTGCCGSLDKHPLPKYLERGLMVTLNTDDPEMFETTLNGEYELAANIFGLNDERMLVLAKNSLEASFLADASKAVYLQRARKLS